jgi:hypothetical protein
MLLTDRGTVVRSYSIGACDTRHVPRRKTRTNPDRVTCRPDGVLERPGAVPVRVTARVVRADTGAPLRDLVHFHVRQRGLEHVWEPEPDARGHYAFKPALLRPGATWFTVYRTCYAPALIRARVEANGHVRLGTIRLVLERAAPGTIGVLLSSHAYRNQFPVDVEEVLLGGPAANAGLRCSDQLLEIDGVPVEPTNAERLVRGLPGTTVTIAIRRYLSDEPKRGGRYHVRPRRLTFTVTRAAGRRTRKRHSIWRA